MAQLGHVALAADPFGGGAITKDRHETMKQSISFLSDAAKPRAPAQARLRALAPHPQVDATSLVSIVYCLGVPSRWSWPVMARRYAASELTRLLAR